MKKRSLTIDAYVVDTLMRDLVGHDRSTAGFLVFLYLWSETDGGTHSFATGYESMATGIGLSKRTVQDAVGLLAGRGLIAVKRAYATALPEYHVRKPWTRRRASGLRN
jgi:hypothetical protein